MSSGLNIVFAGTPGFAAEHLRALLNSEHNIIAVYSQPDRPAGRGKKLNPSPVKQLALEHGIAVKQPLSLKDPQAQAELRELNADIMVVVAYGLLLPQAVLDSPRLGCINVHASLLPRWRGAAPIQRAIEAGDTESGVTIMQMDIGLDTGDMLVVNPCPIHPKDTGGALHDRLIAVGQPALLEALLQLQEGTTAPEAQDDSLSNYARKIDKTELCIDWQQPAEVLSRKVLAFNPFPVCYTLLGGERLKVWQAHAEVSTQTAAPGTITSVTDTAIIVACGEGQLCITQLQMPGKKALPVADVLRGYRQRFNEGQCVGNPIEAGQ